LAGCCHHCWLAPGWLAALSRSSSGSSEYSKCFAAISLNQFECHMVCLT
jgi:hypothetical protein